VPRNFFRRAFGSHPDEFESLLLRPERYLFNRVWYEELGGKAEFDQYQREMSRLNRDERAELVGLLSSSRPSQFKALLPAATTPGVRSVLQWYSPLSKDAEAQIWEQVREMRKQEPKEAEVPEDELVEDAGLAEVA
jgi:hypothetical protein